MPTDIIPLTIRAADERIVEGRLVPYNSPIMVGGRRESFAPGAFAGTTDIVLLDHHDQRSPIGRSVTVEERPDGLYGAFRVASTPRGDEILTLVRDGILTGFSVGFLPRAQTPSGDVTKADLREVSLVTFPAYTEARVLATRQEPHMEPDTPTPPAPTPPASAPTPPASAPAAPDAAWEQRMEDHMRRLEAMSAAGERAPAHRRITPLDWFGAEVQQLARRDDTIMQALLKRFEENLPLYRRALDDVTGYVGGDDDASGLTFPEFIASQIVDEIDTRRPLFASFGSFPLPRSGVATIPVVTQRSLVAPRSGQKQEANSRAVKVVQRSFTAEWYDGALDVALELIATAELSVLAMLWDDLLGQYALATEAAAISWFEDDTPGTGRTWGYHGAVLDTSTYASFVADVATEALEVRKATTAPATRLAVTEAQWPVLVGMVDSTGRRHLATNGPTNADASAGLNAESFVLPTGIVVFPVPGLTNAALYNERAVRAADGGPMQVQATNVAKMGRDIGVLGRTLLVDRIPAGVRVFAAEPDGGDNGTPDGTPD